MTARPFRLTAPVASEDVLQQAVGRALDLLLMPPAMWFALPIGHVQLSPAQAARLARIGTKRGLPDILVIWQGVYGIELKRDGSGLSRSRTVTTRRGGLRVLEGQTEVFPRLIAAGFIDIAVCRSVEAVISQLAEWRVPLRGRVAA